MIIDEEGLIEIAKSVTRNPSENLPILTHMALSVLNNAYSLDQSVCFQIEKVRDCFASLFTNRAISYRVDKGFDHFSVYLSVGVQKMVRSVDTLIPFQDGMVYILSFNDKKLAKENIKGIQDALIIIHY
jgi:hypothetical protein